MFLAVGFCATLRTAGIRHGFEFHWRWTQTPEQHLLAEPEIAMPPKIAQDNIAIPAVMRAPHKPAEWPGFRGTNRDGVVHGTQIDTDWTKSPPVEIWRHSIGPGWSSFAVDGDLIYTQEQRGAEEIVG